LWSLVQPLSGAARSSLSLRNRGLRARVVQLRPRDWSGRGEHYRVEHYLELLRRAPALLDHGKPFTRMPEWLQKTRVALGDDKSLVELLLAIDSQKYTMDELKRACDGVLNGRSVTRAVIEQRALLERSGSSEVVQELEEQECSGLGHHRFAIALCTEPRRSVQLCVQERGPGGARQRLNQRPQPGPPSADDPSDLRLVERRDGAIRLAGKDNATGEAACIVQRCGGAECDDFENVVGRSGQDITEATDTNVESGTVYRYRVYALKPTPQGPRGTGVSNVVTVGAEASR
jgi:hypothetical protein